MYDENADAPPFNPVPPAVLVLAAIIMGVELVFQAGANGFAGGSSAIGWRLSATQNYAFLDPVWDWMRERGQYPLDQMIRFVTYAFIHGTFMHAAFGAVIILAVGKLVGEVFGNLAFLAIFFVSSVTGAMVYGVVIDTPVQLIGSYPGGYGLIGAFTFLLWVNLASLGENRMQAFTLIGVLMGIQLVYGMLFGGGYSWIADLTGFVAGFGLSFLVSPGGWGRILARIRQR